MASGLKIWLSHCEILHKSPQFPHMVTIIPKKQLQIPKERDRMVL